MIAVNRLQATGGVQLKPTGPELIVLGEQLFYHLILLVDDIEQILWIVAVSLMVEIYHEPRGFLRSPPKGAPSPLSFEGRVRPVAHIADENCVENLAHPLIRLSQPFVFGPWPF